MKIPPFLFILLALPAPLCAQSVDTAASKPLLGERLAFNIGQAVKVKPYGFIRNYFNFDSRRTLFSCGGEYNMIPLDESLQNVGTPDEYDQNAVPQAHFLALSSRIGLDIQGPSFLGAISSAKFEGDFAGFGSTNSVFRIRQAFVRLSWHNDSAASSHELLFGQTWHPLSGDPMPNVLGMAAGAPFRPHSRTPQVRYIGSWGSWGVTAAAMYQYQYTSPGPDGEGFQYANQAIVPELFLGADFKSDGFIAQLGVDYLRLRPRTESSKVLPDGSLIPVRVNDAFGSFSPTLYAQYSVGLFSLKFRSLYAQNTGHLSMLSGYAAVDCDPATGSFVYEPMRALVSYLDLSFGSKWRADLFLGQMVNFGLANGKEVLHADFANLYMKRAVQNIHSFYRVACSFSYNVTAFNIGLEYEWTGVNYGNVLNTASVDGSTIRLVSNHRVCAMVKYNF